MVVLYLTRNCFLLLHIPRLHCIFCYFNRNAYIYYLTVYNVSCFYVCLYFSCMLLLFCRSSPRNCFKWAMRMRPNGEKLRRLQGRRLCIAPLSCQETTCTGHLQQRSWTSWKRQKAFSTAVCSKCRYGRPTTTALSLVCASQMSLFW